MGSTPQFHFFVLKNVSQRLKKEIRRAYRKLTMQWHPDKHKFQQIEEAYSGFLRFCSRNGVSREWHLLCLIKYWA
ncbi:uncharacterized protein LOC130986487 [Salvia miltiorrhiza]|uniref:uncharacterized protein LOC130986487 n=1 Tax=Salvia miltiorrhiza TaxID=226208 RepID=UPI0025AC9CCE|nr:uncharacterized protein LOC130986487 [Salvia miltiorrhiza]